MKRLTKLKIKKLEHTAEQLYGFSDLPRVTHFLEDAPIERYSCFAVGSLVGDEVGLRFQEDAGTDRVFHEFERSNRYSRFQKQLARSLAVLMFIEMNR